jgi:hypothetical protein
MKQEQAAAVGRDALIWIAAEPDLLGAFLAGSGLAPHEIRTRVEDAEFLGFVLDFVLGSDASVLAFAADAGIAPEDVARARAAIGGGNPHWT